MASAGLQLEVLADKNIFLEREMKRSLSYDPSLYAGKTKMARLSADRHSYITVDCTLSRDLTPKPPGNPKVYHVSYIIVHISESPLLPVGGNGGALSTTAGIMVLVLNTEFKLPN